MSNTFRDIFKWGDKRETTIDKGTRNLIVEKLGYSDEDFNQKYLAGNEYVNILQNNRLGDEAIKGISQIVGSDNVKTDDYSRASHAHGKSYAELILLRMGEVKSPPDAVVFPRSVNEVVKVVELCSKMNIAITPFGGHSSVTKGVESPKGGISLDLTKHLNKVIEINAENCTASVQPGIYGPDFENQLNAKGFTCGHFPQSFEYSTVGGWVAAKGAGQASTGYGKIEHMLLSLKVVTPSGLIETKLFPASAQGWDISQIFIGSEGTLGVIVEVTLKIQRYWPKGTKYASFIFKDFEAAVIAMRTVMQSGIGKPHLFRISDPEETEIAFKTKNFEGTTADRILNLLGYRSGRRCLMFVSCEGDARYTKQVIYSIKKIVKRSGGFSTGAKPTRKWLEQRYSSAYLRDPLMDIGIMTDTIETAVMWSNLIPLWVAVRNYLKTRSNTVVMVHISHVYENGANLYFTFLSPMAKSNELNDYYDYHKGLVNTIIFNGGSLSHHHGVGRMLSPWMEQHLGKSSLELMQAIKNHLDPTGIMNPGGTLGLKP